VAAFHLGRLPDIQLRSMISAASRPAQPALISMYAKKGEDSFHDLYYRGGRYHLWIALIVVAPLLVFGKEIIELYVGNEYAMAATVIFAFLAVYPFLWASAMFFQVAHAIGKIGAYYICDIAVQVVSVGAMFYAVAVCDLGAPGAAVAMNVATAALHIILIWPMGLRLVRGRWLRFFRQTILPGMFPFAVAFGTCSLFGAFLEMDSWIKIGLASAVSMALYGAVLLLFCLDSLDRSLLSRLVDKVRKVVT
jgi:O-antigen/teichoic acid export membrane protein